MKRALLASTAIVGVGMLMSDAAVAMPGDASVKVKGNLEFHAGWRNYKGSGDAPSFDIREDLEISVHGEREENGYTYGLLAKIKWASKSNILHTDEVRGYIRNPEMGSFEFGDDDGMSAVMTIFFPTIGFAQLDGDVGSFLPDYAAYYKVFNSGDSSKIVYRSPIFGGVSFGVSYAPQGGDEGNSFASSRNTFDNYLEAGVVFNSADQGNLELPDGVSLKGGFTITSANYTGTNTGTNKGRDDLLEIGLGASIGFVLPDNAGKVTVSGGIVDHDEDSQGDKREFSWNFGGRYEQGDVAVAASFSQTGYDKPNSPSSYAWGVGVAYKLATGVELTADYLSYDRDVGAGIDNGSDGDAFIIGTNLSF